MVLSQKGQTISSALHLPQFIIAEAVFQESNQEDQLSFPHPVSIYRTEALHQMWQAENTGKLVITTSKSLIE